MNVNHYIGFDVHKKTINYCVKMADGQIVEEGRLRATHDALRQWAGKRREPWRGAMEATLFSGWIYDTLKPFAAELQMGHPAMMKAIGASKKKNDIHDKGLSRKKTLLPALDGGFLKRPTSCTCAVTICFCRPVADWVHAVAGPDIHLREQRAVHED